ncbi:hypothetical protein [Caballeronia grimmiae]|uniref:hypothetical protein n=1 Tax=Caballeronia grimmiae TaxID=1071679 RepID=UPI0038BB4537
MGTQRDHEDQQKLLLEIIKRYDSYTNSSNSKIAIILSYCMAYIGGVGFKLVDASETRRLRPRIVGSVRLLAQTSAVASMSTNFMCLAYTGVIESESFTDTKVDEEAIFSCRPKSELSAQRSSRGIECSKDCSRRDRTRSRLDTSLPSQLKI